MELDLTFEPHGNLAALAMAPVIERLASSLVDAFVGRARQETAVGTPADARR